MNLRPLPLSALAISAALLVGACGDTTTTESTSDTTTPTIPVPETATGDIPTPDSFADADAFFEYAAERGGYADAAAFQIYFFGLPAAEANTYIEDLLQISPDARAAFVERMSGGRAGEQIPADELAAFTVDGTVATMSGIISTSTPDTVRTLLTDHPHITTIVMTDVPGSADDVANLEAARIIRQAGIATHANADSVLASGGVDFYLAGAIRTYDEGAQFGVHSWGGPVNGSDVPRDDPQHQLYLDYYAEMGIDAEFYWFTLDAAPARSIHWMTAAELAKYRFAT